MMRTFWQHNNGKIYVVESDSFGTITGAAGPLDPVDLGDPTDYACSPGILAWLKRAIAEHKIRRINPSGASDMVPCPIARLQKRAGRLDTPADDPSSSPDAPSGETSKRPVLRTVKR